MPSAEAAFYGCSIVGILNLLSFYYYSHIMKLVIIIIIIIIIIITIIMKVYLTDPRGGSSLLNTYLAIKNKLQYSRSKEK